MVHRMRKIVQAVRMRGRRRVRTVGLAATCLLAIGCSDFHMTSSDLTITPNPAVPGDNVVASFLLSLVPTQSHTIIVIIDDSEHMRVTSSQPPPVPVVLQLGDAAGLISEYGAGEHDVHVVVHASDEAARTQSVRLQLNTSATGEEF